MTVSGPRRERPAADGVVCAVRVALNRRGVRDQAIVVGVSGGGDSVALLLAIIELRDGLNLRVVVAHFDHRMRTDSAADASFVRKLCELHGLDARFGTAVGDSPKTHIEAWCRRERYDFLSRAAADCSAKWVAVAHHADDQAETVLHHMIRGTGLRGLAGIPATRRLSAGIGLIRPCLDVTRDELRQFLADRRQSYRDDPTNDDVRFARNAIRNAILPEIERHFSGRAAGSFRRLAEQAQAASQLIRRRAKRLLAGSVVEQTERSVRLAGGEFKSIPPLVVQEAAIVLWTRMNWPRRDMTAAHWQRAARLMFGEGPAAGQWPGGVNGTRRGSLVVFER